MYVATGVSLQAKPSISGNVRKSYVTVLNSQQQTPSVGIVITNNWLDQTKSHDQVAPLLKTGFQPDGWRFPLTYRRMATVSVQEAYSFTSKKPTGQLVKYWSDRTPMQADWGPGSGLPYNGMRVSGGVYVPDVSSNLIAQVETECLDRLSNAKVNLGNALAEVGTTAEQLAVAVTSLLSAYRAVKHGNYKLAARWLGTAFTGSTKSDPKKAWLALQYGWLPLMSDIYGSAQAIQRGVRKNNTKIKAERTVIQDYPEFPRGNQGTWYYSGNTYVGCKVLLYASIDSAWLDTVNSLGLLNPLEIAWEVLPYSFVVDWLIPVGNVLTALTAPIGLTFKSGTRTEKSWQQVQIKCAPMPNASGGVPVGTLPTVSNQNLCLLRTTYAAFPIPKVYWKSPFSTKHVVSAIALIAQTRK